MEFGEARESGMKMQRTGGLGERGRHESTNHSFEQMRMQLAERDLLIELYQKQIQERDQVVTALREEVWKGCGSASGGRACEGGLTSTLPRSSRSRAACALC